MLTTKRVFFAALLASLKVCAKVESMWFYAVFSLVLGAAIRRLVAR